MFGGHFSVPNWFVLLYKCAHIILYFECVCVHFLTTLTFISNSVNVTDYPLANLYCSFYGGARLSSSNPHRSTKELCNCPLDFKSLATSVNDAFHHHWKCLCAVKPFSSLVVQLCIICIKEIARLCPKGTINRK